MIGRSSSGDPRIVVVDGSPPAKDPVEKIRKRVMCTIKLNTAIVVLSLVAAVIGIGFGVVAYMYYSNFNSPSVVVLSTHYSHSLRLVPQQCRHGSVHDTAK